MTNLLNVLVAEEARMQSENTNERLNAAARLLAASVMVDSQYSTQLYNSMMARLNTELSKTEMQEVRSQSRSLELLQEVLNQVR